MSLRYKTNLLEHAKAVGAWARQRGARATIDAIDLSLTLAVDAREYKLHPQFVGKRDGKQLVYFDVADRFAIGFVGWLPYKAQAWDISLSKLAFKEVAHQLGIATPRHWTQLDTVDAPFLIKRARRVRLRHAGAVSCG